MSARHCSGEDEARDHYRKGETILLVECVDGLMIITRPARFRCCHSCLRRLGLGIVGDAGGWADSRSCTTSG